MLPERIPDFRSARKQIADPRYKTQRIDRLSALAADSYFKAANATMKREKDLHLYLAEVYTKRIKWYLR